MANRSFKWFWNIHKWVGIVCAIIFVMTAVTGFLLLIKKDYDWIQPQAMSGTPGEKNDLVPLQTVIDAVIARDHPSIRSMDDIDRIDFRPDDLIHKVRSNQGFVEFQVDATTGEVVSGPAYRASDLIESIHDGSFFGDFAHGYVMPAVTIALLVLVATGLWLWIEPHVRRRRWRRRRRQLRQASGAASSTIRR